MPEHVADNDRERIRTVFAEAYRRPPSERARYLDEACGTHVSLRAEVESLLQAHEKVGEFLENPPVFTDVVLDTSSISEGPGAVIGRYKLLERIGEGGMAVVYMAEQQGPISRKVALKIIKLGMDTKSVIARFEAERQALAMMDHPNIARVLDARATETGRPYFVMELVQGASITEYCDQNRLSTKERLALFIQVCHAVQHAHQKGIIHRDIKPSNVMVTMRDGRPVPKVIDFGIAKATNQKLTEKTLFTRYAHIIGTPAYMSPEQAELSDLNIDTRSDIYSLGVLLYELLTGTTPFSEHELRKAGYVEMQRIIREQEPTKPSTKLTTLGETLTDTARHRGCTPDLLRKAVRGDLDWIVMKSLEKDRGLRYETANGLAEEIQRHLEHEPVLARGPSATYRLQKFLHRHQAQTLAALTFGILIAVVAIIASMWNQDRLQLIEAEAFGHSGILARARESLAERDLRAALEDVKTILESEHVRAQAQLLYANILVEGEEPNEAIVRLESLLEERPEIAGAAHALLARVYWEGPNGGPERLAKASEHRQRAQELLSDTAEAYYLRALTAATIKETLGYLDRALAIGPDHYESRRLRASTHHCSRNFALAAEDALSLTVLRPNDAAGYVHRANALLELGRFDEAVDNFSKAIELTFAEDPRLVDLYNRRREAFTHMGRYQEALADGQTCVSLSAGQEVYQIHVFTTLVSLGRYEEAKAKYRQLYTSVPDDSTEFWSWCAKYVIDTLESGRELQLPDPNEPAFLPALEAKEMYQNLRTKGRRVITDGFHANWSPDGTKVAYSKGVHGVSGVVVYDTESQHSDLLAVPGKDPLYSPDGRHIAFIRDRQVLPLDRLATDEQRDVQPEEQEEIWIMSSDGAEPRRIVRGKWPHWSPDSQRLFYTTVSGNTVYSIAIAEVNATPLVVFSSPGGLPRLSWDSKYVAYMAGTTLNVFDLSSQAAVAQWVSPVAMSLASWAPNGPQLRIHHGAPGVMGASLWIYDLKQRDVAKVLTAHRTGRASWSSDGRRLAVAMGAPFYDIWILDAESLRDGRTLDEHYQEQLALYTRRIEVDPNDAYAYSNRAQCHGYLGDRASANADMRRWSAILSEGLPLSSPLGTPRARRRVVNLPFDCQLVFSAERPANTILMVSIALGQKGRCEMKLAEIPWFVVSMFGPCLLSGFDAPLAHADLTFGTPTNLGRTLNTPSGESTDCFSPDGLEMYLSSDRPGGSGGWDIWLATRDTIDDEWGAPAHLGPPVNTGQHDAMACMSTDGLSLYFNSTRPGGLGGHDLYMTTRATVSAPWVQPVNLGPTVNSSNHDASPWLSADGLELYFNSNRPGGFGGFDIWVTTRATISDSWEPPINLGPAVNSSTFDLAPSISAGGLLLFFESQRPGGYGANDIWASTRASRDESWDLPVNLGPVVNSLSIDGVPRISPDGSVLYFYSMRPGGLGGDGDLWEAPITPIVDFNGDGKVDGEDLLVMIVEFGSTDASCDIGPFAWGDGVVDLEDLKVLAEHIGVEIDDPTLVAHWPLDETEGVIASDSTGNHDGTLLGTPAWQPAGGQVGGALQFDGASFITADAVLNPAHGPVSVLAWVKGGAPGQTILAQGRANWLMADTIQGAMMTELSGAGRTGGNLLSETAITDGNWHRVALIWDGTARRLCVDGALVAQDMHEKLADSTGNLILGAAKDMAPGTFWTGLIDDVRIYNRAVRP